MAEATKPAEQSQAAPPAQSTPAKRSGNKIIRQAPPGSRRARGVTKARRKGPFVQYVGDASKRTIYPHDWKTLSGVGVEPKSKDEGFNTDTWDVKNDKILEASLFSESQLDYLLIDDMKPGGGHSFLEVDYNEDGVLVQVVYEEDEE